MFEEDFLVSDDSAGYRLDVFLSEKLSGLSRSRIAKEIAGGRALVNGKREKASFRLRNGDQVHFSYAQPQPLEAVAQEMPLEILYEDNDIVVLNKSRGMVVHPSAGNPDGTLVNGLLAHCDNLSGINGILRPGIVHRIDKDTSGVLVVAKNDIAHHALASQLQAHTMRRLYHGLIFGVVKGEGGTINAPIGRDLRDRKKMTVTGYRSRMAVTHYRVLERFLRYTLIEARLETGRTHQIRVHMAHIGHPLVGDPKYASGSPTLGLSGQALHALLLGFQHPATGEYMEFSAPLPLDMVSVLAKLREQLARSSQQRNGLNQD